MTLRPLTQFISSIRTLETVVYQNLNIKSIKIIILESHGVKKVDILLRLLNGRKTPILLMYFVGYITSILSETLIII